MIKKLTAEFIGTYFLVFCGTGAVVIDQQAHGVVTHIGVAITFGLVVMSLIYALGDISGAHMNPAVSIAFVVAKKICHEKSSRLPHCTGNWCHFSKPYSKSIISQ